MQICRAKASLRHWRPLVGLLPWLILGTTATIVAAILLVLLPWLNVTGLPIIVGVLGVIGGILMLVFLIPAQIRALLRETTAEYSIEINTSGITIKYFGIGVSGVKKFAWDQIVSFNIASAGFPSCEAIRINPCVGQWFSFGSFFEPNTRTEILEAIRKSIKNRNELQNH
jgi:tellurite resistance protein TehA-like permease